MGAAASLQETPSDSVAASSAASGTGSNSNQVQSSKRALLPPPTPHKLREIVGGEVTATCAVELEDQLCNTSTGIYLDGKRKKYWLHEKTKCNCFMIFARALVIYWSHDPRYWTWYTVKETNKPPLLLGCQNQPTSYSESAEVEVAKLLKVCWLQVHGKLELSHLTPGVNYDVVFQVMFTEPSGWSSPVTFKLEFPDGTVQKRRENLEGKRREQWLELRVGEVKTQPGHTGILDISMHGYEGGHWKIGLHIKGIKIAPSESSQRSY